jgi:hypothetical protein
VAKETQRQAAQRAEYARIMKDRQTAKRSEIEVSVDSFPHYTLTEFQQDVEICEKIGKSWGVSLLQVQHHGVVLWVAHEADTGIPKAVMLLDTLTIDLTKVDNFNIWWQQYEAMKSLAEILKVPDVLVIKDATKIRTSRATMYAHTFDKPAYVGTRIGKPADFDGVRGLCVLIPSFQFTKEAK